MTNKPIAISPRAAADLRRLLEQAQHINDRLNIYVDAIGAALEVAPGWRFNVQTMTFMPPDELGEIPGLSQEFVAAHEAVFCGAEPADDVSAAVEDVS